MDVLFITFIVKNILETGTNLLLLINGVLPLRYIVMI